ncbi:hypothetical protein ABEI56_13590 [Peribacillus castrilensis]|uniref:hypothetical protein n=1 Tax=Peribacillus TaxID=2675229 RepID=UPI003871F8DF
MDGRNERDSCRITGSRDSTAAYGEEAWQTVGGKGADFWNQLEHLLIKTADIAVIELMSFNLYKNKKIMISENNEKKMLNCKERFYNELPEYNNICCIVVNDYDIGKGSVLVISIMRG